MEQQSHEIASLQETVNLPHHSIEQSAGKGVRGTCAISRAATFQAAMEGEEEEPQEEKGKGQGEGERHWEGEECNCARL